MRATQFQQESKLEKRLSKKDSDSLLRERFALLGYDDYSYSGSDSSGSGDALSSILSSIGSGALVAGSVYQASQYGSTVPQPTLVSNNNISAHATTMGSSPLIWIVLLLVVGLFAYKKL